MKKIFKTAAVLTLVASSGQALSDCNPDETRLSDGSCRGISDRITIIGSPWNIPNYQEWDNRDRLSDDYDLDPHGASGGGGDNNDVQEPGEDDNFSCYESQTTQVLRTWDEEYEYLNSAGIVPELGGGLAGVAAGGWAGLFSWSGPVAGAVGVAVTLYVANWLEDVLGPEFQARCGSTITTKVTICMDEEALLNINHDVNLQNNVSRYITRAVDTRLSYDSEDCASETNPGEETLPWIN